MNSSNSKSCDLCGKIISYWDYFESDDSSICKDCCLTGKCDGYILEFLSNKPDEAAYNWLITHFLNQNKIGLVKSGFQYGFNREIQSDPVEVLIKYRNKNNSVDYIFGIDSVDSFLTEYSIYKVL